MNQSNKNQPGEKGDAADQASEGSCTESPKGLAANAGDDALQRKAPDASFEDFSLDDIEVLESKVFA